MKIAVGFSGGVDSSVTTHLLKKAGHEVIAVQFDVLGTRAEESHARTVAEHLGVEFHLLDLRNDFEKKVRLPFLHSLQQGETPNPCIMCNPGIKFGLFADTLQKKIGVDTVATGHYIRRVENSDGQVSLHIGADKANDQTYFLYRVAQDQLQRTLFPLGELTKPEIRKIAAGLDLPNAQKKSSTDVCFLEGTRFEDFVKKHIPLTPGEIHESSTGMVLGEHGGLPMYTLGQRRNLGVGGVAGRPEMPWFVVGKDFEKNVLLLGQNPALLQKSELRAHDLRWTLGEPPAAEFRADARIRFRGDKVPCTATVDGDNLYVKFDAPVNGVTAGQAVVLYDGDKMLGGGSIVW